ncbi:hypothetical protein BT69DRAFT_1335850 [Atractiella rhizophila]|nr:hypothetical protein BT69DRAFT_1335850 [Atractiella rhizophila]
MWDQEGWDDDSTQRSSSPVPFYLAGSSQPPITGIISETAPASLTSPSVSIPPIIINAATVPPVSFRLPGAFPSGPVPRPPPTLPVTVSNAADDMRSRRVLSISTVAPVAPVPVKEPPLPPKQRVEEMKPSAPNGGSLAPENKSHPSAPNGGVLAFSREWGRVITGVEKAKEAREKKREREKEDGKLMKKPTDIRHRSYGWQLIDSPARVLKHGKVGSVDAAKTAIASLGVTMSNKSEVALAGEVDKENVAEGGKKLRKKSWEKLRERERIQFPFEKGAVFVKDDFTIPIAENGPGNQPVEQPTEQRRRSFDSLMDARPKGGHRSRPPHSLERYRFNPHFPIIFRSRSTGSNRAPRPRPPLPHHSNSSPAFPSTVLLPSEPNSPIPPRPPMIPAASALSSFHALDTWRHNIQQRRSSPPPLPLPSPPHTIQDRPPPVIPRIKTPPLTTEEMRAMDEAEERGRSNSRKNVKEEVRFEERAESGGEDMFAPDAGLGEETGARIRRSNEIKRKGTLRKRGRSASEHAVEGVRGKPDGNREGGNWLRRFASLRR